MVLALLAPTLIAPPVFAQSVLTRDNGAKVGDNQNSQTAGANGPTLLQDVQLIQKLQRFDRERIPERVVHARGTGVKGEFTATADLSSLTKAKVFSAGEKTPVFVRFSSVVHGNHSPETLRDPHGFATKFYTSEGNWDLVGNNFPTFFIRDAIKFPDMVHAFKPDPRTNLDDDSRRFDFFSHVPEGTRTLTLLYSNEGTPAGYRFMDGNGVHAYKLVNAQGEVHYVKFHWKTLQGIKNLDPKQVAAVQAKDYSHLTNDLVGAIKKGDFPKWDLYVQVLAGRPGQVRLRSAGCHQDLAGRAGAEGRPDGAEQERRQLLPGNRAGRDGAGQPGAGHRAVGRPSAAGAHLLLR